MEKNQIKLNEIKDSYFFKFTISKIRKHKKLTPLQSGLICSILEQSLELLSTFQNE